MYYFVGSMITEKEAVSESLANFRAFLGRDSDFGECETCGLIIYKKTTDDRGESDSVVVRECKGFDESGKAIPKSNCLLVKHSQYLERLDSG